VFHKRSLQGHLANGRVALPLGTVQRLASIAITVGAGTYVLDKSVKPGVAAAVAVS
jgi:hypothetical protein